MCICGKDETAERKLMTREMRTSSPSGNAVTFSLRLASGPRAMWNASPHAGMPIAGFGAHRVLCIGLPGRGFFVPPVKNFRCRSPGKIGGHHRKG